MNQHNDNLRENGDAWINPLGGLGDTLMVSGVLKQVHDKDPKKRFNLIRRTKYLSILKGHPAIGHIGFPSKNTSILGTDYWSKEELGPGNQRAFQVLARIFGLSTPAEEVLYMPRDDAPDSILLDTVPWGKSNILIAPASDSPRKEMHVPAWEHLVKKLCARGCVVLQAGRLREGHVRGAYSLRGLTTPRQLVGVLKRCKLVITSDNFVMHTAHLTGTPAVVLWGPTDAQVYGYTGQRHIWAQPVCDQVDACIGPKLNTYPTLCNLGPERHCMNRISVREIFQSVEQLLDPVGGGIQTRRFYSNNNDQLGT